MKRQLAGGLQPDVTISLLRFVIGIQGDYDWSDAKASTRINILAGFTDKLRSNHWRLSPAGSVTLGTGFSAM